MILGSQDGWSFISDVIFGPNMMAVMNESELCGLLESSVSSDALALWLKSLHFAILSPLSYLILEAVVGGLSPDPSGICGSEMSLGPSCKRDGKDDYPKGSSEPKS